MQNYNVRIFDNNEFSSDVISVIREGFAWDSMNGDEFLVSVVTLLGELDTSIYAEDDGYSTELVFEIERFYKEVENAAQDGIDFIWLVES